VKIAVVLLNIPAVYLYLRQQKEVVRLPENPTILGISTGKREDTVSTSRWCDY